MLLVDRRENRKSGALHSLRDIGPTLRPGTVPAACYPAARERRAVRQSAVPKWAGRITAPV